MQTVSNKWAPALASAHGLTTKVDVLYNGSVVLEDVPIVDGSVKVDSTSDIRRALSLSIAEPSSFPQSVTDPWAVYGQRIAVSAGISYTDGSVERVMLGEFVITNVSGDIHKGPLAIEASGKEILLKRVAFPSATDTTGAVSVHGFIANLVSTYAPGESFVDNSTLSTQAIPTKTYDAGSEVLAAIVDAATSVSAEFFMNANGSFELRDITDPSLATPVWTVDAGDGGVLVSADISLSAEELFNQIIVSGENTADNATAVVAIWEVLGDPVAFPLSVDGPLGTISKYYSTSLVTTVDQATTVAKAYLAKYTAPNRTVSLVSIHNHALDAGDCIAVHYGSPAAKDELHVVKTIEHPLSYNSPTTNIETVAGRDAPDPEPIGGGNDGGDDA